MSDGGEAKSEREVDNAGESDNRVVADEYGRAVSKIAVAQICEGVGFQSFDESALEALSSIAVRYLCDLGKTGNFYANLAGRSESNVFDIIQGLEDFGSSSGALEISDGLAGSGAMREIIEYVESAEEIPFAQPVPHFPVIRHRKVMMPSFDQMGEIPSNHIPAWLPAFPDPHTYIHSPMWNERETDPRADKIELARQRRKAESSLLSLQKRLLSNGSTSNTDDIDSENRLEVASKNPFLAKPLQGGEKDDSQVVQPSMLLDETIIENHVSLLETFTPAIEAVKGGFNDLGDSAEKVLQRDKKKPLVHLNFKNCKKVIGKSLDLSLKNKKTTAWFGRDDEKDDKKRRAELILRQSSENPQELNQL